MLQIPFELKAPMQTSYILLWTNDFIFIVMIYNTLKTIVNLINHPQYRLLPVIIKPKTESNSCQWFLSDWGTLFHGYLNEIRVKVISKRSGEYEYAASSLSQ